MGVLPVVREDLWLRNWGAAVRVCILILCGWGGEGLRWPSWGWVEEGIPAEGRSAFRTSRIRHDVIGKYAMAEEIACEQRESRGYGAGRLRT